jgi:hypothetical protein
MDNSVPQSALAWFRNPDDPTGDPAGSWAFDTFVDAYINSPGRAYPTPHATKGDASLVTEPFIELWQYGATQIPHAGVASGDAGIARDEDELWDAFLASVALSPKEWAGWLTYQWRPDIIKAYHIRAHEWEDDFRRALARVLPALGHFGSTSAKTQLTILEQAIETAVRQLPDGLPPQYLQFAKRPETKVAPIRLALANCYDWFVRGQGYRARAVGRATLFHSLRTASVLRESDDIEGPTPIESDLPWSVVLRDAIANDVLPRSDAARFCDVLRGLQRFLRKPNDEYIDAIGRAREKGRPWERNSAQADAVTAALRAVDVPPLLRKSTVRGRLLDALARDVAGNEALSPIRSAAYEVVHVALSSDKALLAEHWLRSRIARRSVWKVLRAPGLP